MGRNKYECSECGNIQTKLLDFDRKYNVCGICKNTYIIQMRIFNDELYFDLNKLQNTLTKFKAKKFNLNEKDIIELIDWYSILYGDLKDDININKYTKYDEEFITTEKNITKFYEDIGLLVINKFKEFKDKKNKIEKKKYNKK